MLVRVDSGLELGDELNKVASVLAVDEFSDTCVILNQLIHQGGGAMKSLLTLKQLIDDRRLTRLQEYISKLSAKMSVVMMVFLFPALLIVLAGPGAGVEHGAGHGRRRSSARQPGQPRKPAVHAAGGSAAQGAGVAPVGQQ
uniref:Type II secretion system protein GspF domain-containing protein n=1 Tax=Tanacetum cinerariifolium TaxID=118510 RepID=A0A699U7X9_TANCI|nr:hypothetical protein [Tanacetum cinerariifolium]